MIPGASARTTTRRTQNLQDRREAVPLRAKSAKEETLMSIRFGLAFRDSNYWLIEWRDGYYTEFGPLSLVAARHLMAERESLHRRRNT
jgi:hypothetical protein